jgi:hypothetical protein
VYRGNQPPELAAPRHLHEASTELVPIAKSKKVIVTAIENGRYSETLMDRLLEFEAREKG